MKTEKTRSVRKACLLFNLLFFPFHEPLYNSDVNIQPRFYLWDLTSFTSFCLSPRMLLQAGLGG